MSSTWTTPNSSEASFMSTTPSPNEESLTETIYQDANEFISIRFDTSQSTSTNVVRTDLNDGAEEEAADNLNVPLCRICWLDGTIDELITLPCKCQGTVGNVHDSCLKEWERVRKSRRCEICKEVYMKERALSTVLRSFFQYRYAGVFLCKICNVTATAMIGYANIVLGEVRKMGFWPVPRFLNQSQSCCRECLIMNIAYLISTEKASPNRNGLSYPVMILSAAIFPYFVINFLAVDFAMSEMIDCYQLIREWWYNES